MPRKVSPIGKVHTYQYGTATIISFAGPWRYHDYRPFEVHPKEPWNAVVRERVMACDVYDDTPMHDKQSSYDADCSCCYLNITHTQAKHVASISAALDAYTKHVTNNTSK